MKNILLLLVLVAGISCGSCSKKDTQCDPPVLKAPDSEIAVLEQYLKSNNIDAVKDERGFYYKINNEGTGTHPGACSNVTVNYRGSLTSGTVFDEASNVKFNLSRLISGWQAGIPLIAKEGKIILYLPPSLGYGSQGMSTVPANSILIFSIELVSVN